MTPLKSFLETGSQSVAPGPAVSATAASPGDCARSWLRGTCQTGNLWAGVLHPGVARDSGACLPVILNLPVLGLSGEGTGVLFLFLNFHSIMDQHLYKTQ